MKLTHQGGTFRIRDVVHDSLSTISPGGMYAVIDLGTRSESYSVALPYENGFYSARLSALGHDTHAGITLLAPQASLDQTGPLITLDDTIRIPVYKTRTLSYADIITDVSPYTVSIDPDITQDENLDGNPTNDFTGSTQGIQLSDSSITFGPYDTLGKRGMILRAVDSYNNLTLTPITLDIYTPVPQITTVTATGMLSGQVDTESDEPVHLLRIRTGTPIDQISPIPVRSLSDGSYITGSLFTGSGVRLVYS